MSKVHIILVISFLIPFIAHVGCCVLMRLFMTGVGGPFDIYGASWILLKSTYYGILGLLIGASIQPMTDNAWIKVLIYCCAFIVFARWSAEGRVAARSQSMNQLGVAVNTLGLNKKPLITLPDALLGFVTDIAIDDQTREITIAGERGGVVTFSDGKVKSSIDWDRQMDCISIARLQGKNEYQFLNRGSWAIPSSLHDATGKTLWVYEANTGVDDTAYGDLDGNGALEFVVGINAGGISVLDSHGKQLWSKPDDGTVSHVEITEPDKNNHCKIVQQQGGCFAVRDHNGQLLNKVDIHGLFCGSFSLCHWPGKKGQQCVITCSDGKVWIVSLQGKILKKLPLPDGQDLDQAYGVPIQMAGGESEYFAVLACDHYQRLNRSVIYIYSDSGQLVYSEILPEDCGVLAVKRMPRSDSLLVGGKSRVWEYAR